MVFPHLSIIQFCSLQQYAIVFDAGSTHTSMFVYKWDAAKFEGTAVARQLGETCNAKGSL